LEERSQFFIAAAKASSTRRAYQSDWDDFQAWCARHARSALPAQPSTVALYLADLASTHRPATLSRRLSSIGLAHRIAALPSPASAQFPVVGETLKGIRRALGVAQSGKIPLLTADLKRLLAILPESLCGIRDRALLLLGFAGGFRRSELAAMRHEDLKEAEEGLVIRLRFSKTDPEGRGREVAIPRGSSAETCPVRAVRSWLEAAGVSEGPVWRAIDRHGRLNAAGLHPDSIGLIVKRAVRAAGLDPRLYAGHSLRAGLATQAYLNGASELAIMRQTGHRSLATVRRYIRNIGLFQDNAASRLGL
jgi:integrase